MATSARRERHEQWLCEITGIPTAAGRELRVIEWINDWVKRRKNLRLETDTVGNLVITQTPPLSKPRGSKPRGSKRRPLIITAHLDHPAFVVSKVIDDRTIVLEFRGGVHDPYFDSAGVEVFDRNDGKHTAKIESLDAKTKPFKTVRARLTKPTDAIAAGDVGRWLFRGRGAEPVIHDGLLHTPACDDLAAVAVALSTLDVARSRKNCAHVSLLFTLAEEVGFIGAIAACQNRSVPKDARLLCLENSRSYAESPIGGGPIVRVGDRISVFDPRLTNAISHIMVEHAKKHPNFKWQRKLMPGGACEASVFSTYGYESTCICLPLGNYHNMTDIDAVLAGKRPAKAAPEFISIEDYHGMIEMLLLCAEQLEDTSGGHYQQRFETLMSEVGHIIELS